MSDNSQSRKIRGDTMFKEAVYINTNKIYDSCYDKDCINDLKVYFTTTMQPVIDAAYSVKARDVEVLNVFLDCEQVPYNQGFYSVDMTYFFSIKFEAFTSPIGIPANVDGLAVYNKKVVLYGGDGNVKTFTSRDDHENYNAHEADVHRQYPKAVTQVAPPMVLNVEVEKNIDDDENPLTVPVIVSRRFDGEFNDVHPNKTVKITLGLFTICQLERNVQILIPSYDFCIPKKENSPSAENPCELFNKINFPIDDFYPPNIK